MGTGVIRVSTDRAVVTVLGIMGAVSLIYQVAWTRQLTTLLGSTVGAVALITSMFMVGMAVGAWIVGKRADRPIDQMRLLAMLAAGLGLSGAATVPLYAAMARIYSGGDLGPSQGVLLAFAAALAVMMTLIPTAFVGAGFPVVSRTLAVHRKDIGSGVSSGYVAGTVGSVAGSLLGGFIIMPALGVNATILLSSAICVLTGIGLHVSARGTTGPSNATAEENPSSASARSDVAAHPSRRPVLIAFTLSGASIMIYETIWTRELLLVFGASVYAVATMLAAALTGLAIGQWLGGKNRQDRFAALGTVGVLQLAGAGAAMLSLLITRAVPVIYYAARAALPGGVIGFVITQFALTFIVVAVPCILLGATAPIAVRLSTSQRTALGRDIGGAYALNTLGAVAGALAGGLLLMPLLSTTGSAAVAAALNVTAAVVALRVALPAIGGLTSQQRLVPSLVLVTLGFTSLLAINSASPLLELAARPASSAISTSDFLAMMRQVSVVFSKDAPQGRVTVVETPDGTRSLHVSGVNEGALARTDIQTTETMVRLPSAIIGDVSDVLIVGLGTGMTSRTALQAAGEPRVDTVEINRAVVEASRLFIDDPIDDDPRSTILIDDARHLYATTDKTYDLVASEPSYPLSTYSARMFTRESFEAAARILNPGGVMVQWLPAYLMEPSDLEMMTKTFASVFPNTHVWVTLDPDGAGDQLDYMLVGINGDADVDPDEVADKMRTGGAEDFSLRYLMGPADVRLLLQDSQVPLNTDDRPVFEYLVPVRYLQQIWG